MKLILPENNCILCDGSAEVKDGILYIYRAGSFKDVMYELTYLIFGDEECYYCHRKRDKKKAERESNYFSKVTLDHLIPQTFGGPTIPNNMRPSCCNCNELKENMYPEEFEEFRRLSNGNSKESKEELRRCLRRIADEKQRRYYGEIPSLPDEMVCKETIHNIYVNFCIMQPVGVAYEKLKRFFKKYKRLQKPIIISKNRFLLDGYNISLLSKYEKQPVTVILLENVIYMGFPE